MDTPKKLSGQANQDDSVAEANYFYATFVRGRAKILDTMAEDLHHATTGMSGEAGEALDITKKMWIYNQPLDEEKIAHLREEAGDSLFYIQHLCNLLHCTMQDLINENVAKLTKRYPQGYSDKAALERADKASPNASRDDGGNNNVVR